LSAAAARAGYVTIVGRPNVGKSTLANLLVGEKVAIVSDVPQTTRNLIRGIRNFPGGQLVIVDTPGIHKPRYAMNRCMVAEATSAMRGVDLILFVIEAGPSGSGRAPGAATGLGPGDRAILELLPETGPQVLLVINKVDCVRKDTLLPLIDRVKHLRPFTEILLTSALTGENTQGLAERLLGYLPQGPPIFPQEYYTDQQERFLAAELIREKIHHHTRQEVPHETCVLIDQFEETQSGLRRIDALILVEKESQKGIVIGRDGSLLKTIGTEAREDLERMLDAKVFLQMWVKVKEGWRDDEEILRKLGIRRTG